MHWPPCIARSVAGWTELAAVSHTQTYGLSDMTRFCHIRSKFSQQFHKNSPILMSLASTFIRCPRDVQRCELVTSCMESGWRIIEIINRERCDVIGCGSGAHDDVKEFQQLPTSAGKATYVRLENASQTSHSHWPLTAASKTKDSQRHCTFLFSFGLIFHLFCYLFTYPIFPLNVFTN